MYKLTSYYYFRSIIRRMDKNVDIRIEVTKITHYVRMIDIQRNQNADWLNFIFSRNVFY